MRHHGAAVLAACSLLTACSVPQPPATGEMVTVPAIPLGASVQEAEKRLAGVGLEARSPDVDFPHYVVGTDPAAGTVVPVGSEVDLLIGDG